jgi:hypothetical protein
MTLDSSEWAVVIVAVLLIGLVLWYFFSPSARR